MERARMAAVNEAREILLESAPPRPKVERIATRKARGRITAEPVRARLSMPSYPASAMDGIAVRSGRTQTATPETPVSLIEGTDFVWINTGDPLPEWTDAVIMVERVHIRGEREVAVTDPAIPFQHVRQIGEDVAAGETLLMARVRIRPVDQASLLAGGVREVPVLTRPRVTIIPTGKELVPPEIDPARGEIIEFNSTLLAETLQEWGAETRHGGIVPDDPDQIRRAVETALEWSDLVIVNAGSSKGSQDFVPAVLQKMGHLLVHGVAARPGKPTALAVVEGKPVLGLPGYPVSAHLSLEWFAKPWMEAWQGQETPSGESITARLAEPVKTRVGAEDHLRVRVVATPDGGWEALPLFRGAGATFSLSQADGWLRVPAETGEWKRGHEVSVRLSRPSSVIRRRLWIAGGDDPALDVLVSAWSEAIGRPVARQATGEQEAVNRWRNGLCVGIVLETDAGGPCPALPDGWDDQPATVVPLGEREWGWWVQKGNPHGITGVSDWRRSDLRWILPPRGYGSRLFLERLAARAGIPVPDACCEIASCLKAAAAVSGGTAHAAWGIRTDLPPSDCWFLPDTRRSLYLLLSPAVAKATEGQVLLALLRDEKVRTALMNEGLELSMTAGRD
ncbi:molybdenum cofactor synthesis domain-containing protein [Desmospora profundinema]|uniref:Molybdopterin molybdenumtransferase n=1 Tax=Desmospora profundinema TaxID=1571184 RepID=A0ABU1ISK0_9BACL|nr:molybdopterin-binding protein [Desmospora profundinema]MDR6227542.1 putative molybdopterin biosynthesis protein [Desmospora profundinema]